MGASIGADFELFIFQDLLLYMYKSLEKQKERQKTLKKLQASEILTPDLDIFI